MRRGLRIAWALGTVVLAQVLFVAVGRAQTEGPCVIQINRTDAGAHAEPDPAGEQAAERRERDEHE